MTSGERMVWAAAFVERRKTSDATAAVSWAEWTVGEMRRANRDTLPDSAVAMLDDMLGTGAERVEVEVRTVRNVDGTIVGEAKVLR
jgi:hypothetical protein